MAPVRASFSSLPTFLALLLLLLLFAPSALPVVVELSERTFDATLAANPKLFVFFFAPWCAHCKSTKPEWDAVEEALRDDPEVAVARIDITKDDRAATRFKVTNIPTITLFAHAPSRSAPEEESVEALKTAVDLEKDGGGTKEEVLTALLKLNAALIKLGKREEALEYLENAIEILPQEKSLQELKKQQTEASLEDLMRDQNAPAGGASYTVEEKVKTQEKKQETWKHTYGGGRRTNAMLEFARGGYRHTDATAVGASFLQQRQKTIAARLRAFYTVHDRSKLKNVDVVSRKYKGSEETMFDMLTTKYLTQIYTKHYTGATRETELRGQVEGIAARIALFRAAHDEARGKKKAARKEAKASPMASAADSADKRTKKSKAEMMKERKKEREEETSAWFGGGNGQEGDANAVEEIPVPCRVEDLVDVVAREYNRGEGEGGKDEL
jgi:thiol-disulfide isomerase/thioredoxin